ncbi:MAG: hypothetical protein ACYC3S_18245 [Chloroflexota bacterium]
MDAEHAIDRALQRPKRYWYEDGLSEMAGGSMFALIGALFLVEVLAPPSLAFTGFSALGLPVLVLGGGWLQRRLLRLAKERITYPRTGYVAYPRVPRTRSRRLATTILAIGTAAVVSALFTSAPLSLAWIPALQGLLVGAAMLYFGRQLGLLRFFVLAAFSAAAGLASSLLGLGDLAGSAAFFIATGLALVVSGLWTLAVYLRRTQPPAEGGE